MHPEAYEGFGRMLVAANVDPTEQLSILDLGGQNVNGTVHRYFTNEHVSITTLDLENADIIADATQWTPNRQYDLVIATEVFEHVQLWRNVMRTAKLALFSWGVFIATCASTNRPPHGATGAPVPRRGEWYRNVSPPELEAELHLNFARCGLEYKFPPGDAYMWGRVW